MKNKKEFFGVLFSVIVCVFVVFLVVSAATTISTDITVGGDLTVTGDDINFNNGSTISNSAAADGLLITEDLVSIVGKASVSDNFNVDDGIVADNDVILAHALQVAHTASVAYSRFGTGTSGHGLANNSDLLITGLLEVDATVSFDSVVSASDAYGIQLGDGIRLYGGTASITGIVLPCDVGSIYFRAVADSTLMLNLCDETNKWTPASISYNAYGGI